jgi:hypothetical protein
MIENAPAIAGGLPNSSPAGDALLLVQRVSEQEGIGAEAAKAIIKALPAGGSRVDWRFLVEGTEDEVSTVASARCTNFPVVGCRNSFEVGERRTEVRRVKDGLAAAKFFKNREQLGSYVGEDHVIRHTAIVWFLFLAVLVYGPSTQSCRCSSNFDGTRL